MRSVFVFLTSTCCFLFVFFFGGVDPFTSTEAVDDSIPNLNPFLTKPVVDPVHLPVVSSDALSFSRTPSHEMFGGKRLFFSLMQCSVCFLSPAARSSAFLHSHFCLERSAKYTKTHRVEP